MGYHRKNNCGDKIQYKYSTYNQHKCRKHRKFKKFDTLHNRKYQAQNCEKISPIVMQNWHFLKCHSNCSSNKCKLLIPKSIKAAIDCSYIYCEGRHGKVLQTRIFLFKRTIVFTGVKNIIDSITQNTNEINSTQNTNYNKNIS